MPASPKIVEYMACYWYKANSKAGESYVSLSFFLFFEVEESCVMLKKKKKRIT